MGLALDEPTGNDEVFEKDGLKFIVEKELSDKCGAIKLDFIEADGQSGFSLSSENPLSGGGCGSCGGSCGGSHD